MQPRQARLEKPDDGTGRLIYVVEDDPVLLEMLAATLGAGPWEVKVFADPAPAWQSFLTQNPKPALLLTDYSMGSMTGLELGERCRQALPSLKVVLMSGTAEAEIADSANFVLDAFVAKPFQPSALFEVVRACLSAQV